MKTSTGKSLNDVLKDAPNPLNLLFDVLLKFESKKYVAVGDISRQYRQVQVAMRHRDFLRFIWRNKDGKIVHYRHTRFPFGMKQSGYLVDSCLKHVADVHIEEFPEVRKVLDEYLFADNI